MKLFLGDDEYRPRLGKPDLYFHQCFHMHSQRFLIHLRQTVFTIFPIALLLLFMCSSPALATPSQPQDGEFSADLNPASFTFTPLGSNCVVTASGKLIFSGALDGEAIGSTRVLVFADCGEVLTSPPGTFRDIFRAELSFSGTINNTPVNSVSLVYQGRTAAGGAITGQMRLGNGSLGVLKVEGTAAQGGSYRFLTP